MNGYERKRRAAELAQINRKQDPRQEKKGKEQGTHLSQLKTFEYLIQDPETAWMNRYVALITEGKKQEKYGSEHLNEVLAGAVVPVGIVQDLRRMFGGEKTTFKESKKGEPFELGHVAAELGCTPEEAATVMAFIILLDEKYKIVNALEHPEILEPLGIKLKTDALRSFFKNETFLNAVTNKALERSLPILSRRATIQGIQHIIRYLRVFEFHPNTEKLRQAFGTESRRAELKVFMAERPKDLFYLVEDYEYLFGPLSKEEFVAIFPGWEAIDRIWTDPFIKRFGLEPEKPEAPTITSSSEETSPVPPTESSPTPPEVVAATKTTEQTLIQQATQGRSAEGLLIPAELQQVIRWSAVALGLITAGGAGGGLLVWEVGKRFETEPVGEEGEKYVAIIDRGQPSAIRSDNFSPESTEFENGENYVAIPELRSMRVTELYTTPAVAGILEYDPEASFDIDPSSLTADNSTEHIIAERFYAQGVALYPPEMGAIDESSIYVAGHTAGDYTVTSGEHGRFRVTLKGPSSKPLEVVYTVRVAKQDTLPFSGDLPEWSGPQDSYVKRAEALGLLRLEGEDDLSFAVRAETTIQSKYRYPKTEAEQKLTFTQAQELFIGDCDVANQDLLKVLLSQGVHAEMVVDTDPVPGREKHGQVRALTYSHELDGYLVTELNATPHQYTLEGEAALTKRSSTLQVEVPEEKLDTPLHEELEALIEEYQQIHKQPSISKVGAEEVKPVLREIEPREWKALGGGVSGYAAYVLKHSFSLPPQREAQLKLTTELTALMIQELQRAQVIPEGADPYEWSRHIGEPEAQAMLKALDASETIRTIVTHLPKYDRSDY